MRFLTNWLSPRFAQLSYVAVLGCVLATTSSVFAENSGHESGGGRVAASAVRVQFASAGAGIDTAAHSKFMRFAFKGVAEHKVRALIAKEEIGREGELEYCLDFFNFVDTRAFAAKMQEIAGDQEPRLVNITFDFRCMPGDIQPNM